MNLDSLDGLADRFSEVSLAPDPVTFALSDEINARRWTSPYAHLYVADVPSGAVSDWKVLLATIDSLILASLRKDEFEAGGVIDAHICFLVDGETKQAAQAQIDEKNVRHVARKYWIERDEGSSAFLSRLTLLPISALPQLSGYAGMGLERADEEWLTRLLVDGPSQTFDCFSSGTGCES